MRKTELDGKPAVVVDAKLQMFGVTSKAKMYEINGKKAWVPLSVSKFNPAEDQGDPLAGNGNIKGTLIIHEWWLKKNCMVFEVANKIVDIIF